MTVNLKMDESKTFKSVMRTMSSFLYKAAFKLSPGELESKSLDPSSVALVHLKLPSEAFKTYDVDRAESFGLDMIQGRKVFSRAKSNDEMELKLNDGNSLEVIFRGDSVRRFKLPLVEPLEGTVPNVNVNSTANLRLPAKLLRRALDDAKLIGDNVILEFKANSFGVSASRDNKSFSTIMSKDLVESLEVKSAVRNEYDIEYLENALGVVAVNDLVSLRTGNDQPIVVKTDIADEKGSLVCFIAPRVERK